MKLLALLFAAVSIVACVPSDEETFDDESDVEVVESVDPPSGEPGASVDRSGSCGNLTQKIELIAPNGDVFFVEVLVPCTNEPFDRGDPPPDSVKDPGSEKERFINEEIHA